MELTNNNYINIGNLTPQFLNELSSERLIKYKRQYVKFLCDCIYDDKLDDVITFKDFCEELDLKQKYEWENNINSIVDSISKNNKDWF